jgi:hypothetical protein
MVLPAKRLMTRRCTSSEAKLVAREKSEQMASSWGMNCGLKPPAAGGRRRRVRRA